MNDQGFENSGHNFAQDHEPVDEVIEEKDEEEDEERKTGNPEKKRSRM